MPSPAESLPLDTPSSETHHMLCYCHHPLDQTLLDYKSIPTADFVPVSLSSSTVRGSVAKKSTCNSGDIGHLGLIPGLGRSPGGRNGNPLQYSCLGNPMDRGAWRAADQRVTKSQARLSDQV